MLEEVTEPGYSGESLVRPGMDLVAAGGVAVVLAQDADRITRDPIHRAFLDEEIGRFGTSRLMSLEELGELESTKRTAERELRALQSRRERVERLEKDRDALLESLAGMAPEERHRIYRMMKLKATALLDGGLEVSGIISPADEVGALELAPCR